MNNILLRKYKKEDTQAINDIFNFFCNTSFACFLDEEITFNQIEEKLDNAVSIYVYEQNSKVIGFGYLSKFHKCNSFKHTGVLTYFILPEFTGKGLGSKILKKLFDTGKENGITNFLAQVSNKNEQSLKFHEKMKFEKTGEMKNMFKKFGESVDIILVQRQFEFAGGNYE